MTHDAHGRVILGGAFFDAEADMEMAAEDIIAAFDTEAEAVAAAPALAAQWGVPYEGSQEDYWNPGKHKD